MKRLKAVAVAAFLHYCATVVALWLAMGSVMGRFDTGRPATPVESGIELSYEILQWPIVPLWGWLGLPPPGSPSFYLNSLLWGATLAWIGGRLAARWRRQVSRTVSSPA